MPDLGIELICGRPDGWPVEPAVPHVVWFTVAAHGEGDLATLRAEELPPLSEPDAHEAALRRYLHRARVTMSDSTETILEALRRVFAGAPGGMNGTFGRRDFADLAEHPRWRRLR